MTTLAKIRHQPLDKRDYDIDYSEWFPRGDNVLNAALRVSPDMPTPPSYAISGRRVKVWIHPGCVSGVTYKVQVLAETSTRSKEVELMIICKED